MRTPTALAALALLLPACLTACLPDDRPAGLRATPPGDGPRVVFELDTRPLPDIPFPNDILTRPDPDSPTGLRVNLSRVSPSAAEVRLREAALDLDGFGTSGPIQVRFDAPLDLDSVDGRRRDFADDPILIVDIGDGPTFGERIPLDLGRGHFPVVHADPDAVSFPRDPHAGASNLVFETRDEDLDGDGVLDPGEDLDGDGWLDRPNVRPDDPDGELLTWYERQSNALVLRPVVPLRPGRPYAVVLTDGIRGRDGNPVRSPFPFIHHTQQTEPLRRLPEALAPHGVAIEAVAFAWVLTTQTATRELSALRDGLHGIGPLWWLSQCVPAGLIEPGDPDVLIVSGETLAKAATRWLEPRNPAAAAAVGESWAAVSHLVAGSVGVPYLLADSDPGPKEGIRLDGPECLDTLDDTRSGLRPVPGDDDEHWRLDVDGGRMEAVLAEVNFWCTVPRAEHGTAPFPVVLYAHDHGRSRLDAFVSAGRWAAMGLATCAIDAVGHGAVGVPSTGDAAIDTVLARHRARDLDGDGVADPGADTFTADALHTRDVIRQTALDWLQLIRVLRSFDGERSWRTQPTVVSSDIADDFDDDGVVDFGGPTVAYHATGEGYGGAIAAIVAGVEPAITSVAPVSAGGGLVDIILRSARRPIINGVVLPMMGPLVLGLPEIGPSGQRRRGTLVTVWTNALDAVAHADPERRLGVPVMQLPPLEPGQLVVLTNLASGERAEARVAPDGGFRIATGTDARLGSDRARWLADGRALAELGDRFRLEVPGLDPPTRLLFDYAATIMGATFPQKSPLVALGRGWGISRQTPSFRRLALIMQTVLEPADPINYARRILPPADATGAPEGAGADLLVVLTAGDREIPVASGLALARAAGLWPVEAGGVDDRLIAADVTTGLARLAPLADVDRLPEGGPTPGEVFDPPLRWTRPIGERGESGLRIALVDEDGSHGLGLPDPTATPDPHAVLVDLLGRFFATGEIGP
ncbi:MAG: hypothetical protein R3F65_03540 [bacterium]